MLFYDIKCMVIYRLKSPLKYSKKIDVHGHMIYFLKGKKIIIPKKFTNKNINPTSFYELKNELKIENIFIEDRVSNNLNNRSIIGHVNKAGFNFLFNKTPFLTFPTFPDMGNIYRPIDGLETITVHTLGPKRFKKETGSKYVFSEIVGLVSPLWHYLNVAVFAKTI